MKRSGHKPVPSLIHCQLGLMFEDPERISHRTSARSLGSPHDNVLFVRQSHELVWSGGIVVC